MTTPTPTTSRYSIAAWRHIDGQHPSERACELSAPRKAAFLDELRRVRSIAQARKNLNLTKATVDGWRARDAAFACAVDAAKEGK